MGLDSFWYIRKTTGEYAGISFGEEAVKAVVGKYPKEVRDINKERGGYSALGPSIAREESYQIGYFRKFNAMHGWVVRHCADDVDECQDIVVPDDKLNELIEACTEVLLASVAVRASAEGLGEEEARKRLKETAMEYLPPTRGFCFSDDDYEIGEDYLADVSELLGLLQRTRKALEKLRAKAKATMRISDRWELVYGSSW